MLSSSILLYTSFLTISSHFSKCRCATSDGFSQIASHMNNPNSFLILVAPERSETIWEKSVVSKNSTCWYYQPQTRGGGTHIGKWYGDVPRSRSPFSGQLALPSLPIYHQCAAHVPPHFQFLEKNSALKTQIFQIFIPKTSHFSRKIHSLEPTFGNLCGTHPPKKKKRWVHPPQPQTTGLILIVGISYRPRLQTYPSPASCLVFLLGTYPLGSQLVAIS